MAFIWKIFKTLTTVTILTFIFMAIIDMVDRSDKRTPEQKVEDKISQLKNKTFVEEDQLGSFVGCAVVSSPSNLPLMTGMKSVFFKRQKDGEVFSAMTEHEFKHGDKVRIVTISHRTGEFWESRFLLALPIKQK